MFSPYSQEFVKIRSKREMYIDFQNEFSTRYPFLRGCYLVSEDKPVPGSPLLMGRLLQ